MSILTEYDPVKEKKKLEYTIRKETRKENKKKLVQLLISQFNCSEETAKELAEETLKDD